MRRAARTVGWVLLLLAGLLGVAGLLTWPPGGLMFALPFVFLMPGAVFGLVGGVLLWLGRESPRQDGSGPGAS
jgi:hypothetical protein